MRVNFYFFALISIFIFGSCSNIENPAQKKKFKNKLDSIQSGFNDLELSKKVIKLDKDTITIVAFGHIYSLLKHDDIYDVLIEEINSQNPDYVWILGDIVFDNLDKEWEYVLDKHNKIAAPIFYAGGNHDINFQSERHDGMQTNHWKAEKRFLKYIGYRYKTIEDDVANYMLINMNDSIDRIKQYLELMLPKLNKEKVSILFTHQTTWDGTMSTVKNPDHWEQKSFSKDTILPLLHDFKYLINGDWNRRFYSHDFNVNGFKFTAIKVGNANEGDKLFITTIKLTKDSLWAYPTIINIPNPDLWKKKKRRKN